MDLASYTSHKNGKFPQRDVAFFRHQQDYIVLVYVLSLHVNAAAAHIKQGRFGARVYSVDRIQ
jgi:hypothetical protein